MPAAPLLFDAVVFDLDGTLVATDRFWVAAARAGARRAFARLGLERPLPDASAWMSMVGLPADVGFAQVFPDLDAEALATIRAACAEEESAALRRGGAALMPGAEEVLTALKRRGVRLGIASNCGRGYLDLMLRELELARWIDEPRCLDSPGVRTKADMVEDLLQTFGTRSAVMVGDRRVDRDAAWENGLPHAHLTCGFAAPDGEIRCEAVLPDLFELTSRLEGRAAWIDAVLAAVDLGPAVRSLGVTGGIAAGKSLFARDASRLLEARGRRVAVVALDPYARGGGAGGYEPGPAAYDLEGLAKELLEPVARGEAARPRGGPEIPAGTLLLLEGPYLLHPRVRSHLDRVLHLAVREETVLRRVAGRDARLSGPGVLADLRRYGFPAQRGFEERWAPDAIADLVVDAENPLGPPAGPGGAR